MKDLVHLLLPRVRFTCTMWSWSELGGATRDVVSVVVVGAQWSYSGRGWRGLWLTWSELGGAVWHGSLVGSLDSSAWLA